MLQKHSSKGEYTRLLTLNLQLTTKRHPRLPHSQMVVQKSPVDFHIPFLRIMVLLAVSNTPGIHNKCTVLNPNWKFHELGVWLVLTSYLITVNRNHVPKFYYIMVSHIHI